MLCKNARMKLRNWLDEKGLSARDFAARVDVSEGQMSRILRGLSQPSPALARRIDEATGGQVTPSDLFLARTGDAA